MGTEARIVLHAPSPATAELAAATAFSRIAQLDRTLSDFRIDSEVSALAAAAGGPARPASPDLLRVLQRALELAQATNGAFDPSVRPLSVLWRRARRSGALPHPDSLRAARDRVDWRSIQIDTAARTVRLARPGMALDFGGIAKGFAADEALAALRHLGVRRALVVFGGEIVAGDAPPGLLAWTVRVQNANPSSEPIALVNAAISSSGDTEQFLEIDGRRYSHVIDPRTGQPLVNGLLATVIAKDALTADALATAVTLLDAAARDRLFARYPGMRYQVRTGPDEWREGGVPDTLYEIPAPGDTPARFPTSTSSGR